MCLYDGVMNWVYTVLTQRLLGVVPAPSRTLTVIKQYKCEGHYLGN